MERPLRPGDRVCYVDTDGTVDTGDLGTVELRWTTELRRTTYPRRTTDLAVQWDDGHDDDIDAGGQLLAFSPDDEWIRGSVRRVP